MKYLKVQGHDDLVRDLDTGAIINKAKPSRNNLSHTMTNALHDINTLKEEISEIKQLLKEIVRNGSS
jgi:hypothetical protein